MWKDKNLWCWAAVGIFSIGAAMGCQWSALSAAILIGLQVARVAALYHGPAARPVEVPPRLISA